MSLAPSLGLSGSRGKSEGKPSQQQHKVPACSTKSEAGHALPDFPKGSGQVEPPSPPQSPAWPQLRLPPAFVLLPTQVLSSTSQQWGVMSGQSLVVLVQ